MEEAEKTTEEQLVIPGFCLKQESRGKIVQSRKEKGETHWLPPSSSQCLPLAEPTQKPTDLGTWETEQSRGRTGNQSKRNRPKEGKVYLGQLCCMEN